MHVKRHQEENYSYQHLHKRISLFKATSSTILDLCQAECSASDSWAQAAAAARCQHHRTGSYLLGSALDPFWAARLMQHVPSPDTAAPRLA